MALKRDTYTAPLKLMVLLQRVGGRGGSVEALLVTWSGTSPSADLGGSSKYSNENFERRRGERFHVNCVCTWVSRS